MNSSVLITGFGVVTGCGSGKAALSEALKAGRSAVRPMELFDVSSCRCHTAAQVAALENPGVDRKQWSRLDRASQMLLIAAAEAMRHAALPRGSLAATIVLGTSGGGMRSGELFHRALLGKQTLRRSATRLSNYLAQQQALDLQRLLDVSGPIVTLANACVSSANAIGYAAQLIAHGEAEIVLAGGYEALSELIFAGFDSLMAATPTMCRPFDKRRDGMVLGEGSAVLVLESAAHARARGASAIAEVAGYGQSVDTHHLTQPHPRGAGALTAMREACACAGIEPDTIDYINAHGTATPQNDAMEAKAIATLLGARASVVPVSSTKAITGHTLGAAGAVEAAISLMALSEQFVPPNINMETIDGECSLQIAKEPRQQALDTVMSNSFGFGGVNASLVFKKVSTIRTERGDRNAPPPIGIAGVGVVTPLGFDVPTVASKIVAAESAFRIGSFDIANLVQSDRLRRSPPIALYAAAAAAQALRSAGLPADASPKPRIGVIAAIAKGPISYSCKFHAQFVTGGARAASPMLFPETVSNAAASHVAAVFGLTGPNATLLGDSAVAFNALAMARDTLAWGLADAVLVVAAHEHAPILEQAYRQFRWLFPKFTFSEGAAALLMTREEGAFGQLLHVDRGFPWRRRLEIGARLKLAMAALPAEPDIVSLSADEELPYPKAARISVKSSLGEAFSATALWQIIFALERAQRMQNVLATCVGLNEQVSAALVRR